MSKQKDNKTAPSNEVPTSTQPAPTQWMSRFSFPDLWQAFAGPDVKLEEFRDNGSMVVRAELPGVDPDKDIAVTVKDGTLHIHAQRSEESSHKDDRSYRSEFRYGSFDRMVHLPAGATGTDVKATYRDGVLEVRVPVDDSAPHGQKIEVTRS